MDECVLLRIHRIGFASPADDCAGTCVEDRYQLGVRAGGRTCRSTAVIILQPFLLVPLDVEIDAEGEELRSRSRQIQNVAGNHCLDSRLRMRNELGEVAVLRGPSPAAVVVAGQARSDKTAGGDSQGRYAGGQLVDANASNSIARASLQLSSWPLK